MRTQELIDSIEHRPWEMPKTTWRFYQEWNDAIFLHWKVDLPELKKFVPDEIEIDLFDGEPWVSMVIFRMEKMRPRYLPSFSPISDFDEINIRTYVKYKEKSGVYFLSIEGGTSLSCTLAKGISELPYRYSKISRTKHRFNSVNAQHGDSVNMSFKIGQALNTKETLDKWLTERYALVQDTKTAINAFEIHHVAWPLSEITIEKLDLNYVRFNKLIDNTPTKIHYSRGVDVIAWNKKKYKK